jgi:hypothetical protein
VCRPADSQIRSLNSAGARLIGGSRSQRSRASKLATISPSPLKDSATECSARITAPWDRSSSRQSSWVEAEPLIDSWWVEATRNRTRWAAAARRRERMNPVSAPCTSMWSSSIGSGPMRSTRAGMSRHSTSPPSSSAAAGR